MPRILMGSIHMLGYHGLKAYSKYVNREGFIATEHEISHQETIPMLEIYMQTLMMDRGSTAMITTLLRPDRHGTNPIQHRINEL